ncbi:MAG TPA: hypothetical protein VG097_10685 [Gemmata sp.]|jgi:hypothetical protein|nr:hypothetical protein [Gemmata sp.]
MPHEVSPDAPHREYDAAPTPQKPTTSGRITMGVVLALGLYLGLRKITIGTVLAVVADSNAWWLSFNGLVAVYTAQAIAVVFGALLASSGRLFGYAHGLAVGVICGGLFLGFELLAGVPPEDLVVYLQPPVLALLGLIAGVVGARVWAVAPTVDIPIPNPSKLSSIQLATENVTNPGKPTIWFRILIGTIVMICGAMMADKTRSFVQRNSAGLLRVQSLGQAEFITWQFASFAVLFGGIIAGAGTGAGIRHGLISGALGGVALLGICLKQGAAIKPIAYWLVCVSMNDVPITTPSVCLMVAGTILLVGIIGGWLGGALFLPLAPENMRRRLRSGGD